MLKVGLISCKKIYSFYENGNLKGIIEANNPPEALKKVGAFYKKRDLDLDWGSISLFKEETTKIGKIINVNIYNVLKNNGRLVGPSKKGVKQWQIELNYKDILIKGNIFDTTDTTIYVLWETIQGLLKVDLNKEVDKLRFEVRLVQGDLTQKSKLVLFFSKKGNFGKIWKYGELVKAMSETGLGMVGRGIEGERPREFRYAMGYDFKTSEKDKDVPDGSCLVTSPFPFGPRNPRRNANIILEKEDWSQLLTILQKDPKRLRCLMCGLFEGETNKIGQKTKFQKGHAKGHLSGGSVLKDNIFAICQYCNSVEQWNLYDIDLKTGKKKWKLIPTIEKRDYKTKLDIYNFLKKHIRKKDL